MIKHNVMQSQIYCKEVSFGNFTYYDLPIEEIYENGNLLYLIIPIYINSQNFNSKECETVTVKYADGLKRGNINAYMADISFAEITDKNTLKLQIEPSGFHPTIGNGLFSG